MKDGHRRIVERVNQLIFNLKNEGIWQWASSNIYGTAYTII